MLLPVHCQIGSLEVKNLTEDEINYIVSVIMGWINNEIKRKKTL